MDMTMDFIIHHDGVNWCLRNEQVSISAPDLTLLDKRLRLKMVERGLIRAGETKKVRMLFDNATLPPVIRQYAQHYFNRVLEIVG